MILYDQKSDIRWFPDEKEMTVEEMKKDHRLSRMFTEPCVLIDDGSGNVYSWVYLSVLASRYGVEGSSTSEETFANIIKAMAVPPRDPLSELDEQAGAIEELASLAANTDLQDQLDEQAAAIEELASLLSGDKEN